MEKKCLVIPWISLYCILMGMFRSFCWAFGCRVIYSRHVLPFLLIAMVSLFCVVQLKKKYAVLVSAAGFLGLLLYILVNSNELTQDFLEIIYYINLRSEAYNGSLLFGFEGVRGAVNAMDSNALVRLVLIFSAVFISFLAFRLYSRGYGFCPVYVVVSLGLLVGRTPDSKAVTFLVTGILIAFMWIARQEKGGRRFFVQKGTKKEAGTIVYAIFAGILLVGIVLSRQVSEKQEAKVLKDSEKYLAMQHRIERTVKTAAEDISKYIKGKISVEGDGKLDNETPQYGDDTVIKLTMTQKPTAGIYLKGFIGGEYQNGEWLPCRTGEFKVVAPNEEYMKDFWNGSYQFFDYYAEDDMDFMEDGLWVQYGTAARKTQALIEYVGRGKFSSYAYVPYYTDAHSIEDESSNVCVIMDGENGMKRTSDTYYLRFYPMGSRCYDTIKEQIELSYYEEDMLIEGNKVWLEYNVLNQSGSRSDIYRDYIKKTYTRFPEELTNLSAFAKQQDMWKVDIPSVDSLKTAEKVAAFVKKQAVYSLELEPVPKGKDYAEYFLLEQKKGYCEHFATAGTLLLRAMGVPARFVQGYRVDPEMFEQNEDGTYTAEILDSNAHAWTEVYEGEYAGWYPIEMTPGEEEQKELKGNTATPGVITAKPSEGVAEEVTKAPATATPAETPAVTTKADANREAKGEAGKQKSISFEGQITAGNIIVFALVFVFLMVLVRVCYLRFYLKRYRKEFEEADDRNMQICIRTSQLLYFMKHCGQRDLEQQDETEWCTRASYLCMDRYDEPDWQELKRVMQKAAFSEKSITEDEFIYYCDMVEDIEHHLWRQSGKIRKCYLYLLGLKK